MSLFIRRFIDVGIAVADLEAAIARYSRVLGVTPRRLTHSDYAYPGLKGARFYLANATISLVASDDPRSPIARFIDSRGSGTISPEGPAVSSFSSPALVSWREAI